MENLSWSQVAEILRVILSISIMTNYFIKKNNKRVACIWNERNVNMLLTFTLNIEIGKCLLVTELNLYFSFPLNPSLPPTWILNCIIHFCVKYIKHPSCLCDCFEGMDRCKNISQSRELVMRTYFLMAVF